MKRIKGQVFVKYISKVIDKYESNKMDGDKFGRLLETWDCWEDQFQKLSTKKQHMVFDSLEELT